MPATGRKTLLTTPVTPQSEYHLFYEDYILLHVLNKRVLNATEASVHYLCSKPCVVTLEAVASLEFRAVVSVYKKSWVENHLHSSRNRTVKLTFPSSMVFRDDYFIRHSFIVHTVILRAWITHRQGQIHHTKQREGYLQAIAKDYTLLETIPPFERPYKEHNVCLTWSLEHAWKLQSNRIPQCSYETEFRENYSPMRKCSSLCQLSACKPAGTRDGGGGMKQSPPSGTRHGKRPHCPRRHLRARTQGLYAPPSVPLTGWTARRGDRHPRLVLTAKTCASPAKLQGEHHRWPEATLETRNSVGHIGPVMFSQPNLLHRIVVMRVKWKGKNDNACLLG